MNTFQSAWYPGSLAVHEIKDLTWFLIIMSGIVFTVVMILLFMAIKGKEKQGKKPGDKFILWSGLIIPTIILTGMLIYSMKSTISIRTMNKESKNPMVIKVIGHQFWWEVHYPDFSFITANEIFLPINTPIKIELTSMDVIHSFWVPNIHGKMDMIPGMTTELNINVNRAGSYRGQCAEFCGLQHAYMAFNLEAIEEEKFNEWVNKKQNRPPPVLSPIAQRGKEVFFQESCHTCHAVKGTSALGKSGPDLSFIASRKTLGAGAIENNPENLRAWIINSQEFKPANRMPSYNIPAEELDALMSYLEGLK